LGECIVLHLNAFNGLITNEPLGGFIYTSTSSMVDEDLLDLTLLFHF